MANRAFYPAQSFGSSRVYGEFEFQSNSNNPVNQATITGSNMVASVARTAAGTFLVTLKDSFNRVVWKSAEVDDSANDGAYATTGIVTNEATATPIQFYVFTRAPDGTLEDLVQGRRVQVGMAFRNGNWGVQ